LSFSPETGSRVRTAIGPDGGANQVESFKGPEHRTLSSGEWGMYHLLGLRCGF
jgi:hypothetical protein